MILLQADKARNLRFTSRAMHELENTFNMSGMAYIESLGGREKDIKTDECITLLYLALKWEDKELTKEKAYDIWDAALEKTEYTDVFGKIFDAVVEYYGVSEEDVKKAEAKAAFEKASKKK